MSSACMVAASRSKAVRTEASLMMHSFNTKVDGAMVFVHGSGQDSASESSSMCTASQMAKAEQMFDSAAIIVCFACWSAPIMLALTTSGSRPTMPSTLVGVAVTRLARHQYLRKTWIRARFLRMRSNISSSSSWLPKRWAFVVNFPKAELTETHPWPKASWIGFATMPVLRMPPTAAMIVLEWAESTASPTFPTKTLTVPSELGVPKHAAKSHQTQPSRSPPRSRTPAAWQQPMQTAGQASKLQSKPSRPFGGIRQPPTRTNP
mmetsp:Transcript_16332/g.43129  ORF Transcript_16332/g.43129 Transcript_16332/m.43129 type:complete len:263 (+) Transcript_16332:384-1172(+)